MTPKKYRKKPVTIEAMRLTLGNAKDVCDWMHSATKGEQRKGITPEGAVEIHTLEGTMRADVGDWVIRGVQGEFYPCKPDIFEATYDEVRPW